MNKTLAEADDWARALAKYAASATGSNLFVIPPFTAVATVAQRLDGTRIRVGTLATQLKIGAGGISPAQARTLMIAYEPAWSIGTRGSVAQPDQIETAHAGIRTTLVEMFGTEIAARVPVMYGGGVSQANAGLIARVPGVDGLFVGRAALSARSFIAIAKAVAVATASK